MMYFPFLNGLFEIQNVFLKKSCFGAYDSILESSKLPLSKVIFRYTRVLVTPKLSMW